MAKEISFEVSQKIDKILFSNKNKGIIKDFQYGPCVVNIDAVEDLKKNKMICAELEITASSTIAEIAQVLCETEEYDLYMIDGEKMLGGVFNLDDKSSFVWQLLDEYVDEDGVWLPMSFREICKATGFAGKELYFILKVMTQFGWIEGSMINGFWLVDEVDISNEENERFLATVETLIQNFKKAA